MEKRLKTVTAIIMLVVIAVSTVGCTGESEPNAAKIESTDDAEERTLNDVADDAKPERSPIYDIEIRSGEATLATPVNLMEGVEGKEVYSDYQLNDYEPGMTDFALRLAKACNESDAGQNVLVSPLSVLMALAMTANGAEGGTLAQMEKVLGFPVDMLNAYAFLYKEKLKNIHANAGKLKIANSIWFLNDPSIVINREFLQTNADYYDADVYSAPFDQTTVSSINAWVNDKTERMIPKIIDILDPRDLMVLVNAVTFDGKWREPYTPTAVVDGEFHLPSGKIITTPFMHGHDYLYMSDDNAQGFVKEYKGREYAFAALLPNKGVNIRDYLESLSGEHLHEILINAEECRVRTSMPKFESDYDVEMNDVLKTIGLETAFTTSAEFGKIGKAPHDIYIRRVKHKTFIKVDEEGTKAGAVTSSLAGGAGGAPAIEHEVYLDRPFIYMLIDMETKTPFFIGVLNTPDPEHP